MAPEINNSYNTYWQLNRFHKLNKAQLKEVVDKAGYGTKSSVAKSELLEYAARIQRGLLCYYIIPEKRLRKIAINRGLPKKDVFTLAPDWSASELEVLDESLCFKRFLDLPPELRCRIYDFYVAGFEALLHTPAQPPLARACRLIRQEILPVFYSSCHFALTLSLQYFAGKMRMDNDSASFLGSLSRDNLAEIRALTLQISGSRKNSPQLFSVTISRTKSMDHDALTGECHWYSTAWSVEESRMLQDKVREALDQIQPSDGKMRLQIDGVYAVRRAMEEGYALMRGMDWPRA